MAYQPKPKKKKLFGAKFTSTLSVMLVLLLLGLGALSGFAVRSLTKTIKEQFALTITLCEGADSLQVEAFAAELKEAPYQSKVTYISPDSAMQIVALELGEDPREFLDFNPLQPSIELHLTAEYANADSLEAVVADVRAMGQTLIDPLSGIDYNHEGLNDTSHFISRVAYLLLLLAGLLLLISISLVDNTIRLTLHSDRFMIGSMRLVGATDWFIRRPIVIGQAVRGLCAALLAIAILAGGIYFGMSKDVFVQQLVENVLDWEHILCIAGGLIALGVVICAFSAWRATGRYLHCTTDELYLM